VINISPAFTQPRLEDIINLQLTHQENGNSAISTQNPGGDQHLGFQDPNQSSPSCIV
jgi:hypothetical protein